MIRFIHYKSSIKKTLGLDFLSSVILLKSDGVIDKLGLPDDRGYVTLYGEVRVLYDKLNSRPLVIADIRKEKYYISIKPQDIPPILDSGCIRFSGKFVYNKFLKECEKSDKVSVLRIQDAHSQKLVIDNSFIYDKYLLSRSYYIGL